MSNFTMHVGDKIVEWDGTDYKQRGHYDPDQTNGVTKTISELKTEHGNSVEAMLNNAKGE